LRRSINIDCRRCLAVVMTVRGVPMAVLVSMLVYRRTFLTWRFGGAFLRRPRCACRGYDGQRNACRLLAASAVNRVR
jgi:hypothetical protein